MDQLCEYQFFANQQPVVTIEPTGQPTGQPTAKGLAPD
jgi:hypothetical protein